MKRARFSSLSRLIIAIIAWFALALQLFILIDNTPGNGLTPLQAMGRFLIFFTVLSNLLVAVSLTIGLINPSSSLGNFFATSFSTAAIAVYIFIVGLVYNIVLRQLWQPHGLQKVADELLHVAVPVLYTLYWIVYASTGSLKWKYSFGWLIFPLIYLIYAMVRGGLEGFYPYPFLDLGKLSVTKVFLNCLALSSAFLLVGFLFIGADKILSRYKKRR